MENTRMQVSAERGITIDRFGQRDLPAYEILSLFVSPGGHLAGIKQMASRSDAPSDRVHHWLWIAQHSVTTGNPSTR
jgi:hypothetical protein